MFNRLSGATRLFPIIGDPIRYVESPMRLTRTFEARDYNGICVPMQVPADDLDAVMAGLAAARNADGILVTMPDKFTAFAHCATSSERAKMLSDCRCLERVSASWEETCSLVPGRVSGGRGAWRCPRRCGLPWISIFASSASIRPNSPSVRSMSAAPRFSSMRSSLPEPGMVTMKLLVLVNVTRCG
jgi:hypothetical protein